MLPALAVTGNDSERERLVGNQKRTVVANLIGGASSTILYTIFVWYFKHNIEKLFCIL
jgi:hypothetical protein